MPEGYGFTVVFPEDRNFRAKEFGEFMCLMTDLFGVSAWCDADERIVEMDFRFLDALIKERIRKNNITEEELAEDGVVLHLSSAEHKFTLGLKAGWKYSDDDISVDLSDADEMPDLSHFRHCIEILRPIEADICHFEDGYQIRDIREKRGVEGRRQRPYLLLWFHYFTDELANRIGGVEHCLRTPCYKVERFCDGVLFQLTEDIFDYKNSEHVQIQIRAMEHLGLI